MVLVLLVITISVLEWQTSLKNYPFPHQGQGQNLINLSTNKSLLLVKYKTRPLEVSVL